MLGFTFWRAKLAWKDLRARRGRSALIVIALALSISGISGVRGAVSVALNALHQGSRASLAGDLSIDTGDAITEKQYAALGALRQPQISGQEALRRADQELDEYLPQCDDLPGQDRLSGRQPEPPGLL